MIWGGAPATQAELRRVLADLDAGLAQIDTPLVRDLGDGHAPLAGRRGDYLLDKVRVLHRLGDRQGVLAAWSEVNRTWSIPVSIVARGDASLRDLLERETPADVRAKGRVASRLSRPFAQSLAPRPLTREERIAAVSLVWSTAREHFVWFDHVPELDWDRAYLDTLVRVVDEQDEVAYWRELMRFTAKLRDGHSSVEVPEHLAPRIWSQPGLRTAMVEGRVLVTAVQDDALRNTVRVGDEIVSVEGRPVVAYAEDVVAPLQSSSTAQDLAVRIYDYALLAGPAGRAVKLGLKDARGVARDIEAPRTGYAAAHAVGEALTLRPDGVAVIRVTQLETDDAARLLESNAERLLRARAWVLDLRGNGGGSSAHGAQVLRWLTGSALPVMRYQVRHNDPQVKGIPIVFWRDVPAGDDEPPRERFYGGPVALLVDARTFSAAEDMAAVFKLMKRGPIVGEPTGGSTGQPLFVPLPGGGGVRICAKRDSFPDGTDLVGRGIVPHVLMRPTVDSVRSGRDVMLEAAVKAVH